MQSVGSLFMFLNFDNFMSGQSYGTDEDGKPIRSSYEYCYSGNVYNDGDAASYHVASQSSHAGWTSMELNSYKQPLPCDATSLGSSISHDAPRSTSQYSLEDAQMWAWGPPAISVSYENGTPFRSTSSRASCSNLNYVYEDVTSTPSPPLSSHEFTDVFDFDFSPSPPTEIHSHSLSSSLPASVSRRRSPRPVRNAPSPSHSHSYKSRDPSPTHSDGDPKRRFPCLILGCNRRFTSQYTLRVHVEAHRPKPRVSFECTLGCSERFSRQHDRLRHEVAKHGKICEFLCHDCGRFFSTGKTLGNHKCPVAQGGTRWVNSSS